MDYHEFSRKQHNREVLTVEDLADAIESLLDDMDRIIEELEHKEKTTMGAFDVVQNITIPNPDDTAASEAFRKKWGWDPHEQIIIKGSFTAADQEIMENASSALKGKGSKRDVELRTGTARRKLLEVMIVDWTLSSNGRKVDVTPENIGRLPANYRKPILEACDEIASTLDEDEQEAFLPSASEPTTVS
ncbi:MAG: hypothetical protein ACJ788_12390 [Ktedonobacteraceae bacterium]